MNAIQFPLERGEKLLWSGTPKNGLMLRPTDTLAIPFSLMWGGFAIFWESGVVTSGAPVFMRLWGIPFVLIGIYMIVGRFFYDAWRRGNTTYGLTTSRAIIATAGPFPALKSLDLRTVTDVNLTERPDGTGTIAFGKEKTPVFRAWNPWTGAPAVPSFEMIPNAKLVYDMLCEAQRAPAT